MFLKKKLFIFLCVLFVVVIGVAVFGITKANTLSKQNKSITNASSNNNSAALNKKLDAISAKLDTVIQNQSNSQVMPTGETGQTGSTSETPLDKVKEEDKLAQDNLKSALNTSNDIANESKNGYKAVTPSAAKLVAPDFTWQKNKPSSGSSVISIVKNTKEVLQLCAKSTSGTFFCLESTSAVSGKDSVLYGQGTSQEAALQALSRDGWNETSDSSSNKKEELPYN